jgi:hypothetical protein
MSRKKIAVTTLFAIWSVGVGSPPNSVSDSSALLPIAKIAESIICCPLDTVLIDGWASIDIGGEIVEWQWDLDGDHVYDTSVTSGELEMIAPKRPGSIKICLRVKDNEGVVSLPDSATLHVMNSPPRVILHEDTTVKIGIRIFFEPVVQCNCSEPIKYEWDFNDDGSAEYQSRSNGNTSRIYYQPGKYYARFTVTDSYGKKTGAIRTIRVSRELPK